MGFSTSHSLSSTEPLSRVREIYDRITFAALLTIAALVFMTIIPFLPSDTPGGKSSSPALVILVSLGIGVLAYFRRERLAITILWFIVELSILWQIFGIGMLTFIDPAVLRSFTGFSLLVASILALALISSAAARSEPSVFACSMLGIALTFTQYYYLAIPLLILATLLSRKINITSLAIILLALLAPFLVIENSLRLPQEYQGTLSLADFASTYAPSTLTYMSYTRSLINMNGPIPAIDPVSFLILIANRSATYATYVNTILSGEAVQPSELISSTILNPVFVSLMHSRESSAVMISKLFVALIALTIIVIVATIVGVYTPKIIEDLPALEEYRGLIRIATPTVGLVLGAIVFYIILVSVSRPLMLKSDLIQKPLDVVSMIIASGAIGGVLSAREYLIQRAEAIAIARIRLSQKLNALEQSIYKASKDLELVKNFAPEIVLGEEERRVEEARAFLKDARSRVNVVGLSALRELEERASSYAEEMQKIEGSLKNSLVSSLGTLRALANRGNNQLESIGLRSPFPEPGEVSALDPLEKVVSTYRDYISSLRSSIDKVYSQYLQVTESLSRLMPREGITKPVTSPLSLFDLGERSEALDMAIALWMRLGETYWERVKEHVNEISKHLIVISSHVDPAFSDKLKRVSEELSAKVSLGPIAIPGIEASISEAMSLCSQILESIRSEILYIQDLVKDLAPEATRVLRFDVLGEAGDVENLSVRIKEHDGSIESALGIVRSLSSLAQAHRSNMRRDEEKIVILIAYPIAKAFIDEQLSIRNSLLITELPFSLQASSIYAKIYTETNRKAQFLEHLGVIEVRSQEVS